MDSKKIYYAWVWGKTWVKKHTITFSILGTTLRIKSSIGLLALFLLFAIPSGAYLIAGTQQRKEPVVKIVKPTKMLTPTASPSPEPSITVVSTVNKKVPSPSVPMATPKPAAVITATNTPAPGPTNTPVPTVVSFVLSSISPSSGPSGANVTLTGKGFGSVKGEASFCQPNNGCGYGGTIQSWSDTEIKTQVPFIFTTAGPYQVYVKLSNGQTSDKINFTLTAGEPLIDQYYKSGNEFILKGSNFGSSPGKVDFYKGSTNTLIGAGSVTSWSDTEVHVTPPSEVSGDTGVQLTSGGGASGDFKYYNF